MMPALICASASHSSRTAQPKSMGFCRRLATDWLRRNSSSPEAKRLALWEFDCMLSRVGVELIPLIQLMIPKSNGSMASNNVTDLTKRPPRSPRVRLGGYVILPRMLDKGRATINGQNGEFHYNCPLDQHVIDFIGLDPEASKEQLKLDKGDGEILEWINANAKNK